MVVPFNAQENEEILSLQQQLQTLKKLLKAAQESSRSAEQDQKEISDLKILVQQESQKKREALLELQDLYDQFGQLKENCLSTQLQLEENEKEKILWLKQQEELQNVHRETEAQLKIAHHHLAKRVKGSSELTDTVETLKQEIFTVNTQLREAQATIQKLEASLEESRQVQKQKQREHEEDLKAAENFASDWESKYFKLYDKLQENISSLKELQKIEEKYCRMQNILSGISTMIEEPASSPSPYKSGIATQDHDHSLSISIEGKCSYQNLLTSLAPE